MICSKIKLETVSVVIPVYNEERYIKGLIKSLLMQDYDKKKIEIIFVDGNSNDRTVELINEELRDKMLSYKILENPQKITPKSVNIGIKEAKNDIIVRLDAHCEYPENYITKCVYYLNTAEAENVGCLVKTKSTTKIGKIVANIVSSKFGVGNSEFRTSGKSGYVDTVPYGTFRKELFDKIGYFNEELIRSEDNEINSRIIKNGGQVYLFSDIETIYFPRDTISKLIKMGFENGKWATYTGYVIPGTMSIRHFIPLIFVLGLIIGTIITILKIKLLSICFAICLTIYGILDFIFTIKNIIKDGLYQILSIIMYPIFHISYGLGSIFGIFKIIKKKIRE